jgi:hypothetical protein
MTQTPDNLEQTLRAVLSGELDGLTPEQVVQLEIALNRNPGLAARLADEVPPLERPLRAAFRAWALATPVPARAWERVEEQVVSAPAPARAKRVHARTFRLWAPFLAAAACLVLAMLWRLGVPASVAAPPLQLATDLEIERLEVYDDATPFVVSVGNSGAVIVWVLQDQS